MSLDESFARLAQPDGDLELARQIVLARIEANASTGRALRLSALARRIDQDVIDAVWRALAVELEDAAPSPPIDEIMSGLTFTWSDEPGVWRIQPRIRSALLADLQSMEADSVDGRLLQRAGRELRVLFDDRAAAARNLRRSFLQVTSLLYRANPGRFQQAAIEIDNRAVSPAVAALEVLLAVDPTTAVSEFRDRMEAARELGSFAEASALIDTITAVYRDQRSGELLPPEVLIEWSRLSVQTGDLERAAALAEEVIARTDADEHVRDEARSQLYMSLINQSRNAEALAVARARLDLLPADAWTGRWMASVEVALALQQEGQFAAAAETYFEAAREIDDPALGLSPAQTGAALVYLLAYGAEAAATAGLNSEALRMLLLALDLHWRSAPFEYVAEILAGRAVTVMRRAPVVALDSVVAQALELGRSSAGSDVVRRASAEASVYAACNEYEPAAALLALLEAQPPPKSQEEWELQRKVAYALRCTNRLEDMIAIATRILDAPSGLVEQAMRGHVAFDRGTAWLQLGELDRASTDLQVAGELFDALGNSVGQVRTLTAQAELQARMGDLPGARASIAAARAMDTDFVWIEGLLDLGEATVCELANDLAGAVEARRSAHRRFVLIAEHDLALRSAMAAAENAVTLRQWDQADEFQNLADIQLARVREVQGCATRPDGAARAAAMRALLDPELDPVDRDEAIAYLRSFLAGDDWWTGFNLAYSVASLGRFDEAIELLITVMDQASEQELLAAARGLIEEWAVTGLRQVTATGDSARAIALLDRIVAAEDLRDRIDPWALGLARVWALATARRPDEAIDAVASLRTDHGSDEWLAVANECLAAVVLEANDHPPSAVERLVRAADLLASFAIPSPFGQIAAILGQVAIPGRRWAAASLLLRFARSSPGGDLMSTFQPSIRTAQPQGWFAKESTTLLHPEGTANVIASSEPLDPTIDTEHYAAVQGELLAAEFPGYEEIAFEPLTLDDGTEVLTRHFRWSPPDGEPVTQIQLYRAIPGRGFTATATTETANFDQVEMELRAVLLGLEFEGTRSGEAG